MKILLGVTGSVAAVLTKKIVQQLHVAGHDVEIIATGSAHYFFKDPKEIQKGLEVPVRIWKDSDEWHTRGYYEKGDDVLHIELGKKSDLLLIAPISANTLASMVNGQANNLLTCTYRAWGMSKPIIIAPAMNTRMWEHPITKEHLTTLRRWHSKQITIVDPIESALACGDTGIGALARIPDIVAAVNSFQ